MVRLKNSPKPLPLKNFGEGMNRLLTVALGLVSAENDMLLIDEIDLGLHHSVQHLLWEIVFQKAKDLNVQVFATTHSSDCVRAFSDIANKPEYTGMGNYIRLQRSKNTSANTRPRASWPRRSGHERSRRRTGRGHVRVRQLPHAHGLPLPAYETEAPPGLDVRAAIDAPIELAPGALARVPDRDSRWRSRRVTNCSSVRARGSRRGTALTLANSPATVDSDYRGEIFVALILLGPEAGADRARDADRPDGARARAAPRVGSRSTNSRRTARGDRRVRAHGHVLSRAAGHAPAGARPLAFRRGAA